MSFFDEADEPPRTQQTSSSSRSAGSRPRAPGGRSRAPGRGGGSGGGSGRRPPSGTRRRPPAGPTHQSIVVRRAVAGVALAIVIVLIVVGVTSCQSSARKSALQDYAHSVNSLIDRSDATGATVFSALSGGTNATTASDKINTARQSAENVLRDARGVSVPSAARTANSRLLLALQERLDGITQIAGAIQPALGTSVTRDAVNEIAAEMARFYSSDVLYKDYVAPALVSALHANHIAVGGADGVVINPKQFLPSIDWLQPRFVAAQLNVTLPSSGGKGGKAVTGLHGHSLTSVAVGGTTLVPGGSNNVPASPTPTFDISFDNGGNFNETDVKCTVTVTNANVSGTKVVPETFAGKSATCDVTLNTSPRPGTYNVVVTIEKVPGEKNTSNNTQTYPVSFN